MNPIAGEIPDIDEYFENLKKGLGAKISEGRRLGVLAAEDAKKAEPEARAANALLIERTREVEDARKRFTTLQAEKLIDAVTEQQYLKSAMRRKRRAERYYLEASAPYNDAQTRARRHQGSLRALGDCQYDDRRVGPAPFGVYAFYDFDGIALYVGKTTEGLAVRIRRHLTNQRTDAVAMSVLDPLEVCEVEVWPLWPEKTDRPLAKKLVDSLEYAVEQILAGKVALFNEKRIAPVEDIPELPASVRFPLYTADTWHRLSHPDLRIARRAATAARLSAKIAERKLKNPGLRKSLTNQLARLQEMADSRFSELGGDKAVPADDGKDSED
ncbi:GIY-YIG nuclease family protein [Micromonospora chersina]|uniref:GIY-YIG nuclease family protein n=1 Tax=Micromonospora chersina TaxID=47854 RepID=UPI0037249CF2